jgi:excisionase family DNA binding protein
MMTLPEAARRAGRDPETIRRWIRAGKLKSRKIGTQHMIEDRALDHWLGGDTLPVPGWLARTSTGEPMPKVVPILRRQRARH